MFSKKNLFLLIIGLFLLLILYQMQKPTLEHLPRASLSSVATDGVNKVKSHIFSETSIPTVQNTTFKPRDEADIAKVNSWLDQNGIGSTVTKNYENSYSDEQLQSLMDSGDFIAADVLSSRYLYRGENEKAYAIADISIALGSYNAIDLMSIKVSPHLTVDDTPEERIANKELLMQYFVYLDFLKLRGGEEIFASQTLRNHYLKYFKEVYGESEPLSSSNYQAIEEGAKDLYLFYAEKRRNMGWPPFDNETILEINEAFSR